MYRHTDSSGTLQRHLPWQMLLSVGRNMIFPNKEVIVYFFLAILWWELDIPCFLLPCGNYSLCAEGTGKAECFLIPRRLVLSHGDTHSVLWHSFLMQVNWLMPHLRYSFALPLKPRLLFPGCKTLHRAVDSRMTKKKAVECFCHWDFNNILTRTKQKRTTAAKLHRQHVGESSYLYSCVHRKGYW